jgi:hypothetical protein
MQLTGEEATFMAGHEIGDPIGAEFRTIEAGMRLGRDLESLLWEIGKHIDAPEFRFFVIALSVQREAGGNLAETLSNLADVLRRRRTMRAKGPRDGDPGALQHDDPWLYRDCGQRHPVDDVIELCHAAVHRHPRARARRHCRGDAPRHCPDHHCHRDLGLI